MFALVSLLTLGSCDVLLGADFRPLPVGFEPDFEWKGFEDNEELEAPAFPGAQPVLGDDRANKLLRMRFYIWNYKRPFQPNSKARVEDRAGSWHQMRYTYGAEVIDPLAGQTSKIFDPSLKTQLFIHGFSSHVPLGGLNLAMEAHSKRGDFNDYNFIGLDWQSLAAWQLPGDGYGAAAHNVAPAGIRGAHMLLKMIGTGANNRLENFHIIGHSLGCHVAGNMGRTITAETGQKIAHLTAMEPAGPKFVEGNCADIALKKTDAKYIMALHTDGAINKPFVIRGELGDLRPTMADANFYFNGGHHQPGCSPSFGLCSHQRSFHYYAEAVYNREAFKGFRCSLTPSLKHGWHKLATDGCLRQRSTRRHPVISDESESAYMTDVYTGPLPMGNYAIETNKKYPYSDSAWNNQ